MILKFIIFATVIFGSLVSEEITMKEFLSSYYSIGSPRPSKLVFSIQKNYRNISMELIVNGEDPNGLPIGYVIANEDEELLRLMVDYGADPTKSITIDSFIQKKIYEKSKISTPYNKSISTIYLSIITNKNESILNYLLDFGINPYEIDGSKPFEDTPLGRICYNGDLKKFLVFLKYVSSESLSLEDKLGRSLLHIFDSRSDLTENYFKIGQILIENNAKIETENYSALATATMQGNLNLVKLILQKGASPNFQPKKGAPNPVMSAWLDFARREEGKNSTNSNLPILLKQLTDAGLQIDVLLRDVNHTINFLLYPGGETPLGYTMIFHLYNAGELLLESGANPELLDKYNRTPLMRAAEMNFVLGADLLIKHGANPLNGWKRPIEWAIEKHYQEMIDLLIDAEISGQSNTNQPPR